MSKQLTPAEHSHLWDAFRSGSRSAFSQLYKTFSPGLYRYGYNLVQNRPLVEDCLHELFLYIHENRARLGATNNIRLYLNCALRRRLLDTLNQVNKLHSDTYLFDQSAVSSLPYESTLINEQILEQQKRFLASELNKLPRRQQEILRLVYMNELTYDQTAEALNISLKTVYNTVNIGLKALRFNARQLVG